MTTQTVNAYYTLHEHTIWFDIYLSFDIQLAFDV